MKPILTPSRRIITPDHAHLCERCGKRIRRRRSMFWPQGVAALNMAAGSVLLDDDGKVRLDDDGRVMLSDGEGDECCCGEADPCAYLSEAADCVTLHAPDIGPYVTHSAVRVTLSGITAMSCISTVTNSVGSQQFSEFLTGIVSSSPNGVYTLPLTAHGRPGNIPFATYVDENIPGGWSCRHRNYISAGDGAIEKDDCSDMPLMEELSVSTWTLRVSLQHVVVGRFDLTVRMWHPILGTGNCPTNGEVFFGTTSVMSPCFEYQPADGPPVFIRGLTSPDPIVVPNESPSCPGGIYHTSGCFPWTHCGGTATVEFLC